MDKGNVQGILKSGSDSIKSTEAISYVASKVVLPASAGTASAAIKTGCWTRRGIALTHPSYLAPAAAGDASRIHPRCGAA